MHHILSLWSSHECRPEPRSCCPVSGRPAGARRPLLLAVRLQRHAPHQYPAAGRTGEGAPHHDHPFAGRGEAAGLPSRRRQCAGDCGGTDRRRPSACSVLVPQRAADGAGRTHRRATGGRWPGRGRARLPDQPVGRRDRMIFDEVGPDAVYLSTTPDTAIAEYGQAEQLFSPGTMAAYRVTLARIVDFSGGFSPSWDALWREWDCAWKDLWFRQRIEPPTWEMADRVLAAGAAGLAFPSTQQPGGVNLVLYPDQMTADDLFEVHDPDGLLPRDRTSWRSSL
ncbi:RES family NAD+ phosphorylase [Luteimonas salinilitoris]|uniref:RES family NAD+ phosphorylase n=1 Tax=Luteimonas salinilitoris TaxID=3237697 RepID=A0ABV4HVV5_9GAMM